MTKTGDTFFTNEKVDNILVSNDGWLGDAAKLYANGHDLKDLQLSPVYGDLSGFPPTILTSGTRDLFLSNTVRVHRKLRRRRGSPRIRRPVACAVCGRCRCAETKEHFGELRAFFDKYLAK
jgi:acetyl esterase/lipase